jgi:hypothetical protein
MTMWRKKASRLKIIETCVLTVAVMCSFGLAGGQEVPDEELLDRVAERLSAYPELKNMEARATSRVLNMDKNWKPKKTTLVEKVVRMTDGLRSEEILSAQETSKGRSKDVTAEFAEDARKQAEKARKRRAKNPGSDDEGDGGRREFSMEQMFPFDPGKRTEYTFVRKGGSYVGTRPVHVIETRAKVPSDERVDGLYYIDKRTFDVLQAEVRFSKNPKMLKRFEMEARFKVLPEGHLVMERSLVRIHVGLVIKSIRVEAQEEYRDYRILD